LKISKTNNKPSLTKSKKEIYTCRCKNTGWFTDNKRSYCLQ